MAIPDDVPQRIGADYVGSDRFQLADGTVRRFGYATVEVAEAERSFAVLAKDGAPLAGLELFRDMHLHIEAAEGGAVLAEDL